MISLFGSNLPEQMSSQDSLGVFAKKVLKLKVETTNFIKVKIIF